MAKIIVNSRINIPTALVSKKKVDKFWTKPLFEEAGCAKCPLAPERPCGECYQCPSYKGTIQLYKEVENKKGETFYALPNGNRKRVKTLLGLEDVKWNDVRPFYPLDYKVKLKWPLYDGSVVNGKKTTNQKKLVQKWLDGDGSGMIQAVPRSGKTIMSIAAMLEVGGKFLIIAHESRLLEQFYKTMMGDPIKKTPPATNLPFLERKYGKTLVKIITNVEKDLKDNPDLQIGLVTYQKFIKKGTSAKRIKLLNKHFSGIIVDEVHQANSFAYARFIGKLTAKYKLGLSATPLRKDGLDFIMRESLGRVVAKATTTALTPRIELIESGITTGRYAYKSWTGAMKFLANSKPRLKLLVRDIFKDLRNGRMAIIIPVDYKTHGQTIVDALNKQAHINNRKRDEDWPEEFAALYQASSKKAGILEKFDTGQIKVLVGIRSMIKQGIDMSLPDVLHMVIPMSSSKDGRVGAPIFEQLSYRVATWTPNKKDPVLKLWIDGIGFSTGCFRGLFFHEILPGLKNTKDRSAKYRMNDADFKRALEITKMRSYTPLNAPGEYISSEKALKLSAKEKGIGSKKISYGKRRNK